MTMEFCSCDQTYRNRDGITHAFDCRATLIARLRRAHSHGCGLPTLEGEAADEIERLRTQGPTVDRVAEIISQWCWDHSGFEGCAFRAHSRGLDANTRYGIAEAIVAALEPEPLS